jgi:predicted XRE-type DNA-binding protein
VNAQYKIQWLGDSRERLRRFQQKLVDQGDILVRYRTWQEAVCGPSDKAAAMKFTKGNENVFIDCGFSPAQAENLRIRSRLMIALIAQIQDKKLTQARAARIMRVSQPRISDLVRGKIGLFTIDSLVNMLNAAGLKVDLEIRPMRTKTKAKKVA